MADLATFLKHNVEGYLFNDLRALQGPPPPPGTQDPGLCYPLLMTSFAGIELLGALLCEEPFRRDAGNIYFRGYWIKYLYPLLPESEETACTLYQLVRHGIAHAYVLKGPIGVVRRQPAFHLKRDVSGLFYVDAVQLAEDFMKSYESNVLSILSTTTGAVNHATMTTRLGEIEAAYNDQAAKRPITFAPGAVMAESVAYSSTLTPPITFGPFKP